MHETIQTDANATLAGVISGDFKLTKTGNGNLTLTRSNSFTGGIEVTTAFLAVANGRMLGSGTVTLNGGTLQVSDFGSTISNDIAIGAGGGMLYQVKDITLTGTISGSDRLAKEGCGMVTLAGDNSTAFSGTLSVEAGEISVAGDGNLGTGAITLNGGTLIVTGDGVEIDNAVTLGTSHGTVETANALILSGVIGGAGNLTKDGAGTLSITGSAANTSSVTVTAGATLSGSGRIGTEGNNGLVTIASGGTLAPGASLGKLTLNNGLTLSAGATLAVEIDGSAAAGTDYDQVAVKGAVDVSGATLSVTVAGGFDPNTTTPDTFSLIANDGSDAIVGTFADLAEGATQSFGSRLFAISYLGAGGAANDLLLTATAPPPTGGSDGGGGAGDPEPEPEPEPVPEPNPEPSPEPASTPVTQPSTNLTQQSFGTEGIGDNNGNSDGGGIAFNGGDTATGGGTGSSPGGDTGGGVGEPPGPTAGNGIGDAATTGDGDRSDPGVGTETETASETDGNETDGGDDEEDLGPGRGNGQAGDESGQGQDGEAGDGTGQAEQPGEGQGASGEQASDAAAEATALLKPGAHPNGAVSAEIFAALEQVLSDPAFALATRPMNGVAMTGLDRTAMPFTQQLALEAGGFDAEADHLSQALVKAA